MAYESLIQDREIVQGDSSPIWFVGLQDSRLINDGVWSALMIISEDFGKNNIITRPLPLNSGTGEGDGYQTGTKFIFQILPTESAQLEAGKKYSVTVEVTNTDINYNGEIARFKTKVLQGSN
jgi:hypothetical protein